MRIKRNVNHHICPKLCLINMIVILLQNIVWVANSLLQFLQFLNIDLCDTLIDASEEAIKELRYLDYFSLDKF